MDAVEIGCGTTKYRATCAGEVARPSPVNSSGSDTRHCTAVTTPRHTTAAFRAARDNCTSVSTRSALAKVIPIAPADTSGANPGCTVPGHVHRENLKDYARPSARAGESTRRRTDLRPAWHHRFQRAWHAMECRPGQQRSPSGRHLIQASPLAAALSCVGRFVSVGR